MRRLSRLVVLVVSIVVGYGLAVAMTSPTSVDPAPTPLPGGRVVAPPTSTTTSTFGAGETTTTAQPAATTYLLWSSGGLHQSLVDGLRGRFDQLSIVAGDVAPLSVGQGRVVPLDALAIDPDAHHPFDPEGVLAVLQPGTVVLGESSAGFRGLSVGGSIDIGDSIYDIVGIAPDPVVGAAEVVFARSDPTSPARADRFALVQTEMDRVEFETLVRAMHQGPTPLRIRAQGETPWMRHGDAVLPQIFIKLALGEFSYPADATSRLDQDQLFLDDHITTADVPILGRVTCHRVIIEMLRGAMLQLTDEGLSHLIDPGEYAGCWNPRFIRTVAGTPAGISRHSWGAALDINVASNGLGASGDQDPRLVAIMQEWGFIWGGDWAVPDPMHFEYGIQP